MPAACATPIPTWGARITPTWRTCSSSSDTVGVGPPRFDGALDGIRGEVLGRGALGQRDEFAIGRKAQGHHLAHSETCVEQLAGHGEVAEVLFGADGAILGLQGENPSEERREEATDREHHNQRGAIETRVISPGLHQVDDGTNDGGALAVSGNRRRREIYLPMVKEFAQVGMPYCYRCAYGCKDCARQYAAEVERAIEATEGEAAAFVFEPVSGATLGAAVPPEGYLQQVAEICSHHGLLLIADEVMTGMGRTGRNFAVEHWGVAPDVLVTAKGLSSASAPLGAVIATQQVVDAIAAGSVSFVHGFTYSAHPISLAAGRAVLQHLQVRKIVQTADSRQPETIAARLSQSLESERIPRCRRDRRSSPNSRERSHDGGAWHRRGMA